MLEISCVIMITTNYIVQPLKPMIKRHKPNRMPQKPKGILVKYDDSAILLKPHLIRREGSLYSNPVEQIHSNMAGSPLKKRMLIKTVNFMLPHTEIRIEGTPDDNKNNHIKPPKRIQFQNKLIPANDDLRTAFSNRIRKEDAGNLGFLKKKYGKRLSTNIESCESSESSQKRFKKEIDMDNPRPQKPIQFASMFRKSSLKRFNWTASLHRPIRQAENVKAPKNSYKENRSPVPKTVQVTGLFADAASTPVKQPVIESQYNTPNALLGEFNNFRPLPALLYTDSDESFEIHGSDILDYYDISEKSETSTPAAIMTDTQHRPVSLYSEKNFFKDDQSSISPTENCKNDTLQDLSPGLIFDTSKSTKSIIVQRSPSNVERQAPLSPPSTPRDNAKTVIDVSGNAIYLLM